MCRGWVAHTGATYVMVGLMMALKIRCLLAGVHHQVEFAEDVWNLIEAVVEGDFQVFEDRLLWDNKQLI